MKGLIGAEWLKIRKRRLPWVLAACLVGIIEALYVILLIALTAADTSQATLARDLETNLQVQNVIRFGDALVYRVTALLAMIMAAVVVANEYSWRTVVLRSWWTGERIRPLAATLVVVAGLAFAGLVLGYFTVISATLAINAARGTLAAGDVGAWLAIDTGLAILRAVPALFVFIAMAAVVAALTKSSAAGIAIPLGVLFLEPLGTALLSGSDALRPVTTFTLSWNIDALLAANGEIIGGPANPPDLPSAWAAAAFLLFYACATLAVGARLIARRQVTD